MFTGVQVVRITGIFYFLLWVAEHIIAYFAAPIAGDVPAQVKLFGPYWLLAWFSPLMYLLLTQVLWFKKLYMKKPALITISLLLLVLPSRRFVQLLRYLYEPGGHFYQGNIILELFLNCIVFTFIVLAIIVATGKLKQIQKL